MTRNRTSLRCLASNFGFKSLRVCSLLRLLSLLALIVLAAHAQSGTGTCQVATQPSLLRAEGLTEPIGDILFSCSGFASGASISGAFMVSLPVNVTNRVDANSITTQAVLSIDYGLGATPSGIPAFVNGRVVTFSGVTLTPTSSTFSVRISGIRADVNQVAASKQPVAVDLATPFAINTAHVPVGTPTTGLYATVASGGIPCTGSPVPSSPSMSSLFAAGTSFASTRVTEGFTSAFGAKGAGETSGTRLVITYSGFPANAQVYIPDYVAGSDAIVPTAGGDLGGTPAGGQYLPGSGTLLLARVLGADINGVGGAPLPAPTGASAVSLNSVTGVSLTGGAGYAVYEVMDANPGLAETAQFPTFAGLPSGSAPGVAQESLSFGPISTVTMATSTDPVPRFAATMPGSDCSLVGDCQASYFPKLNVPAGPILLSAIAGGAMTSPAGYIPVQNVGGGTMIWSISVDYQTGSGWIHLDQPSSLINSGAVRVFALPKDLAAGTYQANIVISAGAQAGAQTVPVTLNVQAAPPAPTGPTVVISKIVNAATFLPSPLVSGSVATLQGSHLSGKNVTVTVGAQAATLLYIGDSQINFTVPPGLGSQSSADVIVTVDGVSSAPVTAVLAPAYPVIFPHGIRNQDWSENTTSTPTPGGTVLQIFGTGIPGGAAVTAQIGSHLNLIPLYAGAAPTVPGVQQLNIAVPSGIAPGTTQLIICASVSGQPHCSDPYDLAVR